MIPHRSSTESLLGTLPSDAAFPEGRWGCHTRSTSDGPATRPCSASWLHPAPVGPQHPRTTGGWGGGEAGARGDEQGSGLSGSAASPSEPLSQGAGQLRPSRTKVAVEHLLPTPSSQKMTRNWRIQGVPGYAGLNLKCRCNCRRPSLCRGHSLEALGPEGPPVPPGPLQSWPDACPGPLSCTHQPQCPPGHKQPRCEPAQGQGARVSSPHSLLFPRPSCNAWSTQHGASPSWQKVPLTRLMGPGYHICVRFISGSQTHGSVCFL